MHTRQSSCTRSSVREADAGAATEYARFGAYKAGAVRHACGIHGAPRLCIHARAVVRDHLLEKLTQELQPNTRDSELIKRALFDTPAEFMERHVYAYTPEQLYEMIC